MADAPRAVAPAPPVAVAWAPWFVPAAAVTLVLDLVSKPLAKAWFDSGAAPSWIEWHHNTGVAWSMFHSHPALVAIGTLLLIPLLAWMWWRHFRVLGPWENLAFGAVLGGACGNAFDRVAAQFGAWPGVRDFIHVDLGVWPANPWPTFNLADAGITGGFLILVVRSFARHRAVPAAATGV